MSYVPRSQTPTNVYGLLESFCVPQICFRQIRQWKKPMEKGPNSWVQDSSAQIPHEPLELIFQPVKQLCCTIPEKL